MILVLLLPACFLAAVVVLVWRIGGRSSVDGVLDRAFPRRVLRQLGAELDAVAADEAARLERELTRYLLGPEIGRIVGATEFETGMSLALSDGKILMVGGVAHCTRRQLVDSTTTQVLRPASAARAGVTYRLVLDGHDGPAVELFAQRIALVGA